MFRKIVCNLARRLDRLPSGEYDVATGLLCLFLDSGSSRDQKTHGVVGLEKDILRHEVSGGPRKRTQ